MSGCGNADALICPCGQFVFPSTITNPPGLDTIAYRLGDYTSFRHALLLPRAGETQLTRFDGNTVTQIWRPGAQGDLAVQMIEWWAYLADVLTFYNERVANQAYLRTADRPESVNRLVFLLGYRPRPGIGAIGTLAALATGPNAFTLPAGFQVQSKPGPGQQPQVFELESPVTITPPIGPPGTAAAQGTASVNPPPTSSSAPTGSIGKVVLAGTSSAVKVGDRVLILPSPPPGSASGFAVATVTAVTPEKDPLGNAITTIGLGNLTSNLNGDVSQFQLWRTNMSSQVWPYPAEDNSVIQSPSYQVLQVNLVSIVRGLTIGDPIVFEFLGGSNPPPPQYGALLSSTEVVWYANPAGYTPKDPSTIQSADPSVPPGNPPGTPPPTSIAIPHTEIKFGWTTSTPIDSMNTRPNYLIRYGWKLVGNLIAVPMAKVPSSGNGNGSTTGANGSSASSPVTLQSADDTSFPATLQQPVLVQDVNGNGATGVVSGSTTVQLTAPYPSLVPPLQVLFNLLKVSRGKTVANEVLGSGNALVAGQDFVLQNAPVTYLQDPASISGDNYSSTVQVWVNGLEWSEMRSFYGQSPAAQVFVTYEDEQGNTHVLFGDGQNGARLPTGTNNVVATYRFGSGALLPTPGSLTVVLQPQPGLRAIVNPVALSGGSDPTRRPASVSSPRDRS